jgi:hypothetical protein
MTFADLIAGEAIVLDANPFGNGRYAEGVAQHIPGSRSAPWECSSRTSPEPQRGSTMSPCLVEPRWGSLGMG